MPVWEWMLDIVGLVLLLALLYGISLIVRRRFLARNGGTFELSYRARTEHPGRGWLLGIGRYSGRASTGRTPAGARLPGRRSCRSTMATSWPRATTPASRSRSR